MTSVRSLLLLLLSYIQISYSAHVVQSQQVLNLPAEGDDGKHHGSLGLLELHKQLVDIESISSNEHAVGDFLASYLAENGFKVETQPVGHGDRFNIWAWPGDEPGHSVLVTSHIDTVPPYLPYKRYSNGSIYGRGANDAKSCVAAQITAVLSLHRRALLPPSAVTLLFVVGEETAGDGMQAASRLNRTYSTVIFGEPTENNLVCGHKGLLTLQIRVRGKAAHSGYPWLGLSATEALTEALKVLLALRPSLPKSAKFGASTVNIGTIRGGVAGNVVAESAEAAVAIRLAGGPPSLTTALINDALEPLQEWVGMKGGSLEVVYTNDAYGPVDIDCDVDGFDTTTVNYGTDIPNLHSKYEKRYLYGPGSILVAHSDHEFVTIKDLELAVDKYEVLIRRSL